jgi:glutathione peroxidase
MKTAFLFVLFTMPLTSVYDFKVNSIEGEKIDFTQYKGKTLLIVNTASECGFTPQYAELQKLHEQYGSKVKILGFPAKDKSQAQINRYLHFVKKIMALPFNCLRKYR